VAAVTTALSDAGLGDFVRRHRVHYEVVPDVVVGALGRTTVGFEVRLFALHDKGEHALPVCEKCHELVAGLSWVARSLLVHDDRPILTAIEPFDPVLYDSHDVPGGDEVALAVRLSHREHYALPVDAVEERCLKEIRGRLKALGVPER
jgi:hypothetical protein